MARIDPKLSTSAMPPPLMTVDDVAAWLSCSRRMIYAWAETGRLPHIKVGRLLRFSRTDVEAILLEATSTLFEVQL